MVEADLARLRSIDGIKWTKYGSDILPAWVADMDFDPDPRIKAAMTDMVDRGDLGYNLVARDLLIPTFADWQQRRHGWRPAEDECQVFTGTLHALEAMMVLHTRPGDGVMLSTPIYEPFRVAIEDSGRRVVDVPLDGPDWRFDPERFEAAVDATTRVVLFCQPHNPLGRIFAVDELEAFADIVERHDLLVITDEIWADLVFDDKRHLPLATVDPRLAARTVTLGSASKTFNLAGIRCAVAHIGPVSLRRAIGDFPMHLLGAPSSLSASATVTAWTECDDWVTDVVATLQANRDHLLQRVETDLPGVSMHPPEATYLAWLDFADSPMHDNPSKYLYKHGGVALEPGAKFGAQANSNTRLNFATSTAILDQVVDRIAHTLQEASA